MYPAGGWKVRADTALTRLLGQTQGLCVCSELGLIHEEGGRCLCTRGNPDLFTPAALGFLCRLPALLLGFLLSIPWLTEQVAVGAPVSATSLSAGIGVACR